MKTGENVFPQLYFRPFGVDIFIQNVFPQLYFHPFGVFIFINVFPQLYFHGNKYFQSSDKINFGQIFGDFELKILLKCEYK